MTDPLAVPMPNVGPGPDPLALGDLAVPAEPADPQTESTNAADPAYDAVAVLCHRDYHAGNCRRQLRAVADRYEAFREAGGQVVSILPEPAERVREWVESYDVPFPVCADPDATVPDALGQPVRFGALGRAADVVGRMPAAFVLDAREPDDATVAAAYRGSSAWDRPTVEELLDEVRAHGSPRPQPRPRPRPRSTGRLRPSGSR